ncbi:MAG: protein kinase domain-containing protein [Bryobacteraceae bacterium]
MIAAWRDREGHVVAGKYRLQQYLGGRQNSAVFLTESDGPPNRKAAIKLVPEDPATAEAQLSRWREASILAHPHLLQVFDSGRCQLVDDSLLYVVMECSEDDLSQVLPDRALTAAEVRDMLTPALDAVQYLHGKGFVHGHLKPSNVMSVADQLKISIDGLYRGGEPSAGAGSPGPYDPPEMARGGATPAWDAWSLGVTLVEALTQCQPVWEGARPVVPETLPAPFGEIASGCLEGDPQRRWTLPDIAARLEGRSLAGPPAASRRWLLPAAAAGLVVVAVLGPRLVRQSPESAPVAAVAPELPAAKPEPTMEPSRSTREASKQKASQEKRTDRPAATGGEVIQQVLPDVLPKARGSIQGKLKINIKVSVDATGKVLNAASTSRGASKYFSDLAVAAARKWTFKPPRADGREVESEWMLRFEFTRAGTKVVPERTSR